MNFQGEISDFPMHEVTQIIAMGRRTGKLSLDGEIERLIIYFIEGEAVFARPVTFQDGLGEVLLSRGFVSRENISNGLRLQRFYTERGTDKRLGTILVELGVLSRSVLVEHLKRQVEDAIYAILSEDSGSFSFDDELDLDEEDILVHVDIDGIIQDGIRIIEERKRVKKSSPSLDAVYERNEPRKSNGNSGLAYLDWKVISLIDGERTVSEIIDKAGRPLIEVLKTLKILEEKGIIKCRM